MKTFNCINFNIYYTIFLIGFIEIAQAVTATAAEAATSAAQKDSRAGRFVA